MVNQILNYRFIQITLGTLIILGAVTCVFTPDYSIFKVGARFSVHFMLSYLFLGLLFLGLGQERLLWISFGSCAAIGMFLKYSTNSEMQHPVATDDPVVEVAHFDLSVMTGDATTVVQRIIDTEADLISLQEMNPDWEDVLTEALVDVYPYSKSVSRLDPFGVAIFSRLPITEVDTFMCDDAPNLFGKVKVMDENGTGEQEIGFITTSLGAAPLFYPREFQRLRRQLLKIAVYAKQMNLPVLTMGYYNEVSWANELKDFRTAAELHDSRRAYVANNFSLTHLSKDHIFHSKDFKCVDFKDLSIDDVGHMGIIGSFQLRGETSL